MTPWVYTGWPGPASTPNNGKHRNKGRNDDGSSQTGRAREPTSIWTANKFSPLGELPLAVRESGALFLGLTGSTAQCCKAAERPGGLAVWASATRLELNSYGQTNKQTSHKSKYQLKLFVTTILAKMNVVQAEDARSRAWPCSYERHVCEKLGFPLQESDVNRIHVALLRRDPRSKSGNQLESRAIAMVAACAVTPSYGASRHRSRTEICVFLHIHVTCVVA